MLPCNKAKNFIKGPVVTETPYYSVYEGQEFDTHIIHFKDVACVDGQEITIPGKGVICNKINEILSQEIEKLGIETHFIKRLNMREQKVYKTQTYPFNVQILNRPTEKFKQRYGIAFDTEVVGPVIEFVRFDQEVLSSDVLIQLGILEKSEMQDLISNAKRINDFLKGYFLGIGLNLDFCNFTFGQVIVGFDETTIALSSTLDLDQLLLCDKKANKQLTPHSQFFHNGKKLNMYQEVARRIGVLIE